MQIDVASASGTTVLQCSGPLCLIKVHQLSQAIDDIVEARTSPGVVLDVGDVDFVDSSGLGELLAAVKRVRKAGGVLCLARPTAQLRRMLCLTNLASLVPVRSTVNDAVELCGKEVGDAGTRSN